MMAFLKLEDLSGTIEVIVFPKTLDRLRSVIAQDALVKIKGRVSIKEDELPKLICETIEGLERIDSSKVYLRVEDSNSARELNIKLKELIQGKEGDTPVYIYANVEKQYYKLPRDRWIDLEEDVLDILKDMIGSDNVKIIDG